ncbi:MAG: 2-octaprenyl-6-methoxyphenyl hydroxylase [Arsenophonus sp.]
MKIIIVGGGMAGASLALAISVLSGGKIHVSLIENSLPNNYYSNFDARTIVLTYSTCQQFNKIGVLSGLKSYLTPIIDIHISEYGHWSTVNIKAKDYSIPALGYIVKLYDAKNYLFEQLKKAINVKVYCPDKVISVWRTTDNVSVKLSSNKILTGELLVAADGTYSMIGESCKIEWQRKYYQQCAIITNVLTSETPYGQAFERFTEYGSIAMLPMSKGRNSLVWCYPLKKIQYIMQCNDNKFMEKLQKCFGWRLGKIQEISRRYCFPLLLSRARRLISHRLVLIGNAAQTLHPIAGQGFNLGMRDAMVFAGIISEIANCGGDIGSYSVLMQYQIQRSDDRQNIIKLTNNLIHLFSTNNLLFSIVRKVGLIMIEILPSMRDAMIYKAFGGCFSSPILK